LSTARVETSTATGRAAKRRKINERSRTRSTLPSAFHALMKQATRSAPDALEATSFP
jgi:hypothetical protein